MPACRSSEVSSGSPIGESNVSSTTTSTSSSTTLNYKNPKRLSTTKMRFTRKFDIAHHQLPAPGLLVRHLQVGFERHLRVHHRALLLGRRTTRSGRHLPASVATAAWVTKSQ